MAKANEWGQKLRGQVDPGRFGLPPRTVLVKRNSEEFILVIDRKSRIIMKDALTIIEKVGKVKEKSSNAAVILQTNAPVCSKSIRFLRDNGIAVEKIVEK